MAGLGILLYGLLYGATEIGKAIDNAQMKSYSYQYTDKGEPTWIDRNGHRYINGERVIMERVKRPDGFSDIRYVGKNSRKVYYDPQQAKKDKLDKISEENKQRAIANRELAYLRYDHIRKIEITCEISTGKYIAKLLGDEKGFYWKFYLSPDNIDPCTTHIVSEETKGILITQEEYDKLNIFNGSHIAIDFYRGKYFSN